MIIGLTGATGFLGPHVIRRARAEGCEVVAFSRTPAAIVPGASEVRAWSVDDLPDVAGCDAFIHLAGEPVLGLWTRAKRAAIRESRILGTRRLVAALEAAEPRPPVLVSASAIGYYGDRGDEVLEESAPSGTGFLAGVTRDWEAEAAAARAFGVRVVHARIGLVLGPEGGPWPLLRRVFRLGLGGRLGSGRQWMSWIHVHDAASLLVTAVTDVRYSGPVNLVSPQPVTNADLTRAVASALHRPAVMPVPGVVLRTLLRDQAGLFLDSQRVVPRAADTMGYSHRFSSIDAALQDLVKA